VALKEEKKSTAVTKKKLSRVVTDIKIGFPQKKTGSSERTTLKTRDKDMEHAGSST
jgi:hypothetical protein